eukprot:jgi/Botrbrau1/20955/Bobra.0135s0074.2
MLTSPVCFFLVAVAYTVGWTTFSSLLAWYKGLYGARILLEMQAVYLLPSIPILVMQHYYDEYFDRIFGRATATAMRMATGLGGSALVCAVYPLYMEDMTRGSLLAMVASLGALSSISFGSSYQLVSQFPAVNIVALSVGFVGSGPLVLLAEVLFRIGPNPSHLSVLALFSSMSLVTFSGLVAALYLLRVNWARLEGSTSGQGPRPRTRDRERLVNPRGGQGSVESSEGFPFLPASRSPSPPVLTSREGGGGVRVGVDGAQGREDGEDGDLLPEVGSFQLLQSIWPAALCLFLSIATSILVFPFFTYVRSSGWLGNMLMQALFAARLVGDVAGRFLPSCRPFATRSGLLCFALLKTGMTVPAFFYLHKGAALSDEAAVAWVFLFWLLGGYLNTRAYMAAPRWAPKGSESRAGGLMALVFQLACLAAVMLAFVLEASIPSFLTSHVHLGMVHLWR